MNLKGHLRCSENKNWSKCLKQKKVSGQKYGHSRLPAKREILASATVDAIRIEMLSETDLDSANKIWIALHEGERNLYPIENYME